MQKVLLNFLFPVTVPYALSLSPTLFTARILFIQYQPPLFILQNTNQNKVSETDHEVTQKLSQLVPTLTCFRSIFWG